MKEREKKKRRKNYINLSSQVKVKGGQNNKVLGKLRNLEIDFIYSIRELSTPIVFGTLTGYIYIYIYIIYI